MNPLPASTSRNRAKIWPMANEPWPRAAASDPRTFPSWRRSGRTR
jgi:hypothetical protein